MYKINFYFEKVQSRENNHLKLQFITINLGGLSIRKPRERTLTWLKKREKSYLNFTKFVHIMKLYDYEQDQFL